MPGKEVVTQGAPKFYGLDHLRALAIILVFFYHYRIFPHPQWLEAYVGFGWSGVDLFFVLSGFLISSQLFRQLETLRTIQLREFFIKRFFRIIPPYLVVVALYFCIPGFREREALAPLWKFLTFTQNFGLDVVNKGTFSHAWSLCVEEQFYLTLPFFLLLFFYNNVSRVLKYVLPGLLALTVLLRFISWQYLIAPAAGSDDFWIIWYKWLYYPTPTRLDSLITGVSIAAIIQYAGKIRAQIEKHGNVILVTGLVVLAGAYFFCQDQVSFHASVFGFLFVATGYGLLVAAAVSRSSFLYKARSFFTTQLAALSYAVYLSHKGVIHVTQLLLEKAHIEKTSNVTFFCCIVSCILVGYVFRLAVERPALYCRNVILEKRAVKNTRQAVPSTREVVEG